MRYYVAQLLKEPLGSTRSYQLEETFTSEPQMVDRVQGQMHLLRTHQGVLVTAELDTQVTFTCSRCLGEFNRPSTIVFEEEFLPTLDIVTGRALTQEASSEGALSIDASRVLDLTEAVRQYVITDAPMKPLCQENCQGLCQVCGFNLNQEKCNCSTDQPDPRWGALAELANRKIG